MINLKRYIIFLLVLCSAIGYAQSFSSPTIIPANGNVTVNGVTITTASTGDANNSISANPKTPCLPSVTSPELTTVPGQLRVGSSAGVPSASTAWSVTLNFSSPVNNVVFSITAVDGAENFIFNSNGGPVSLSYNSCYMNVTGNQAVTNGVIGSNVSDVTGGFFQANSPFPYTQLTINGNGGGFGSVILLSGGSVGYSGTIDSDGDSIADESDLDDDNDGILDCDENLLGANASVSNVFSFVTAGTAIATSNNEVRLTQDTGNQAGRIWSVGKVDFTKSFVLRFDAYLGTRDNGADGIAAVFHNSPQGVNATGATGLGIGARGIANGIVLELDTYNNGTSLGDIPSDHGQIWDSDNQTSTGFLTTAIALPNLENSAWHPVVINWNATTKTISYTVDGTNAGTYTGDLVTNYFAGANKVYFGYTASTGGATNEQKIRINSFCSDLPLELDKDGDGIPNSLDLDSDEDGCPDAIEGSENVKYNQIHALDLPVSDPNYSYRGQIKVKYDGVTTGSPSQIISTSAAANGVPQLLNNAGNNLNASTNPSNLAGTVDNTDGTADIGQGIGDSQDNTINSCKCYKAPSTDGNNYPTNHGITAFNRAGVDNQNWPMVRQSGWTALEASTKGFVINRMPASTTGGYAGEPVDGTTPVITSPIAGMMFYDTTNDCLKINVDGTRSGWKCFNKQTCPDEN